MISHELDKVENIIEVTRSRNLTTDNAMVKRKRTNGQTTIYKTVHRERNLTKIQYITFCVYYENLTK